ncbi:hypothetical protein GCM10009801_66140 [Streptomyces albiaxialis]|uniref:Uncharacterized protein n=1 Tax=Streptomyces albiaxialis TaxID=329523 RepID=A0ABN2WRA0_9ACTN
MNTPPHGPYDPDPHSPYGRQLRRRLNADGAGPGAEAEDGNAVTRAAADVFRDLENAVDAGTGASQGQGPGPAPGPHSHLAAASEDFFERLDRGVREIAASTERATEGRRGFTLRRRDRRS